MAMTPPKPRCLFLSTNVLCIDAFGLINLSACWAQCPNPSHRLYGSAVIAVRAGCRHISLKQTRQGTQ